VLINSFL